MEIVESIQPMKIRGNRKPFVEIEQYKAEMLSLIAKGFTKKDIIKHFKEKGIAQTTVFRYWNGIFDGKLKEFLPTLNDDLQAMRWRILERIRDARLKFESEGDEKWLEQMRRNDELYLKFFQSAGILKNEATTINIGIKTENVTLSAKEPLEEFIELNKKHLRDLIDAKPEPVEAAAIV